MDGLNSISAATEESVRYQDLNLFTYDFDVSAKDGTQILQAIENASNQDQTTLTGLNEAIRILTEARQQFPKETRLQTLLESLTASRDHALTKPSSFQEEIVRKAFENLIDGKNRMSAANSDTTRITTSSGAWVSSFDRRMIDATIELSKETFRTLNTPAASIFTYDGKVVTVGVNRAYFPLSDYSGHAEGEALEALEQRTYAGMAYVLSMYQTSGGKLDRETQLLLKKLKRDGLNLASAAESGAHLNDGKTDHYFVDDIESLEDGGFFDAQKIAQYAVDLQAYVDQGGFPRDDRGDIINYYADSIERAIELGLMSIDDLASWSTLDAIYRREKFAKMTLYTSLEPCGMCLQDLISHGQVGRVVFAASDKDGGGLPMLEAEPKLYLKQERVPTEFVGGIQAEEAQLIYDFFFREIYPKLKDKSTLDVAATQAQVNTFLQGLDQSQASR